MSGLLGLVACSSPKGPEVPTVAAPAAAEAARAEDEEPVDLTPVAAPENIVSIATWRAPARSLDTVMGFTGLGLDFRTFLQSGPAAPFLPVLDLDAPVDAVVTLDPKVKNKPKLLFAVSVGLTSRQAALDVFRQMETPAEYVEPGVHSVKPTATSVCFIAAALGKARVRLVCSQDRESLDVLSPYLTRGNPSQQTGDSDLHVELRAEPAWRQFGDKTQFLKLGIPMVLGEVSIGNPEFDAALRDAASALVDELILELEDLKDIRLDAWVRPGADPATNGLDLQLGLGFRGSKSWMAAAMADGEGRATAAPESFWKLPLESTEAVYYAQSNPALGKGMLDHMERLLRAGLAHLGASATLQRDWPLSLRQALSISGPAVSSRGKVPADLVGANPDARAKLRASFGYTLVGVEDEQSRYAAWLAKTLELYEDATLRKSLAQKYGLDPAKLPKVQNRRGPAKLAESRVYEIPVPAAIIAKAQGDEAADPATLGGPIPVVIMTCREGKRTWLGFSSYAELLEQRMAAVAAPPHAEGTLAQRTGIERLRSEKANVAGFWTLAGLASGSMMGQDEVREALSKLGESEVPIYGRMSMYASGPRSQADIHVPAQVFKDIATGAAKR